MTEIPTRSVFDAFGRIGQRMRQIADAAVRDLGLSAVQGRTIGYIEFAEQGAGVIQRDIAEQAGMRPASASALLQGLEEQGYIERRTDPKDERRKTLHTTEKGRAVIAGFHDAMVASERELLAPLSESEVATLFDLLDRLDAGLA